MPSGEAKAKKTGKASKPATREAEQNVPETAAPGTPDKDDKDKETKTQTEAQKDTVRKGTEKTVAKESGNNGIIQVTEELPVYLL